ncbi:MAG: hypothetical protein ACREMU_05930, partial [Gemmatimonadaceae bacterium]
TVLPLGEICGSETTFTDSNASMSIGFCFYWAASCVERASSATSTREIVRTGALSIRSSSQGVRSWASRPSKMGAGRRAR